MASPLTRKTFRVTFEVSVEMDSLEATDPASAAAQAPLRILQQALLRNEPALNRHLLAAVFNRLQEYMDQAAEQDDLAGLRQALAQLTPSQRQFFTAEPDYFARLTQELRHGNLSAELNHSTVEQAGPTPDTWELVWQDQLLETELGRRLAQLGVPNAYPPEASALECEHYLLARNLTQRQDGLYCEGRCTCGATLTGCGEDEDQALAALWQAYRAHSASFNPAGSWRRLWQTDWDAID